jgi:cell division protease FtsH
MAKSLLEWETLDADQLNDIMAGLPPRPPKPTQSSTQPPRTPGPSGAAETVTV